MSNKKVNVLFLAYDGMTDPLGQSQVLSYLRILSKQGYSFDVLSFEKPGIFEQKRHLVEEMIAGYDITWHPLPYTKSPPIISTVKDLLTGWREIKKLAKTKHIDIVHSRGYIIGNLARATKGKYGSKMVFDMRGWWPDEKLDSGNWAHPMYKPVYKYFKHLEKQLFAESDYSISLTHVGKDEVERLKYKEADKVGVIPTCVDFEVFKPFSQSIRQEVRQELNIPLDAEVLLYSGSLGGNYDTIMMLDLFRVLKTKHPNSAMLILSKTDKAYIDAELAKHQVAVEDVRVVESDFKHVHRYLMAGDYGIVNYSRVYSTIGRSPTKLGEYWACGLPVVALSNVGDIDYLVNEYHGGGVLIEHPEQPYYEKAVKEMLELPVDKDVLRQHAIDYYDIHKGAATYGSIYREVMR